MSTNVLTSHMSEERFAALLRTARALVHRINRARAFAGVSALVQAGVIRFRRKPLLDGTLLPDPVLASGQRFATPNELAILRTKGNPAVKLNELFRIYPPELAWLTRNHPELLPLCRQQRYADDEWWRDPRRIDDAKPKFLSENWGQARSLALATSTVETTDHAESQEDQELGSEEQKSDEELPGAVDTDQSAEDDATEGVAARNQDEREDLIAEIESLRSVQGEDWGDPEYPVLEAQARFSVRGSNDDLDDLFGEEPKDPRTFVENNIRLQTWSANGMMGRMENARQGARQKFEKRKIDFKRDAEGRIIDWTYDTEGELIPWQSANKDLVPNSALPEGCRGQDLPEVEEIDRQGRPRKRPAFFVTRQEFFASLDEQEHHREAINRLKKRKRTPGREPLRHEHPLFQERLLASRFHVNPSAPEKPRLKKGQKHLIVAHKAPIYEWVPKTNTQVRVVRPMQSYFVSPSA